MSAAAKRKANTAKESKERPRGFTSPLSPKIKAKARKKKSAIQSRNRSGEKKMRRIKAILLMCVALFFFGYMIYSGGSTAGYLSLVIGLVCGLLGALYIREGKKGG